MPSAVYPGSFDPVTYGHLDIIDRAINLFDSLIVAVAEKGPKEPLFSVQERVEMLKEVLADRRGIEVVYFSGLLVDYLKSRGITFIIRGLRAISDFDFELQMALTNSKLAPEIDTVFLMTKESHLYLSSSTIKELAKLGGRVSEFVPASVEARLREKFAGSSQGKKRSFLLPTHRGFKGPRSQGSK